MARRHTHAWDMQGVADPEHRTVITGALDACGFPFGRIRRRTGKRVPVAVSDLTRWTQGIADSVHLHVHQDGEHGHALTGTIGKRHAALGLYWLPTGEHPAGRVEVEQAIMHDVPLAQEVFLAEAGARR